MARLEEGPLWVGYGSWRLMLRRMTSSCLAGTSPLDRRQFKYIQANSPGSSPRAQASLAAAKRPELGGRKSLPRQSVREVGSH